MKNFVIIAIIAIVSIVAAQDKAVFVKLTPEKAELFPGETLEISVKGYNSEEEEVEFEPEWEQTGGTIKTKMNTP